MTPEEIKKIAYYICEKRHKEEEVSDSTTFIFPIDIYVDIVTKLSERYCIVEKSEILADYEFNAGCFAQFSASGDDRCNKIAQWHKGKCDELESLFGKDAFEEEM